MSRTGYGYGRIPEEGFLAFRKELTEGWWGEIPVPDKEAGKHTATMLLGLPADTRWKMRLAKAIGLLAAAAASGPAVKVDVLDQHWDSSQRKLDLEIQLLGESDDPHARALADRLSTTLLAGDGRAQTQLAYDKEVDFGRRQVELGRTEPLGQDLRAAGLEKLLREIEIRTEALAEGIGRGGEGGRPSARWLRVRDALRGCANAFNAVHDALDYDLDQAADGPDRGRLLMLRAALEQFLERHDALKEEPDEVAVAAPPAAAEAPASADGAAPAEAPAEPAKKKPAKKKPAKKAARRPAKKPARKGASRRR
ncbi:MAG: hypothetical protein HY909_26260 [Deltaproteobacteria bacterium]|nr:hypothetical protein [Deltaproteobacteria bacterium]